VTALVSLLQQPRAADSEVAWRREGGARTSRSVRWDEFQRDVTQLHARLAGEPLGGWLLFTEDAYALAVALFALWHSGRHAVFPPNQQAETLRFLRTQSSGVITDHTDWVGEGSSLHPLQGPVRPDSAPLTPLSPDAVAVELFTSGTTGRAKSVAKRIRHLDDEVTELSRCWDSLIASSTVFSTASHQHLYGLLFGVLWPLRSGHTFHAHHFLHVGELLPRMLETDRCVLASVPTTLKRLARHLRTPLLEGRCRAVFSSGGPLATDTAHEIASQIGTIPLEVLGSTETGGIGWRRQAPGASASPWESFPSVRVTRDEGTGLLRVRSPFVSVPSEMEGFATGDRISLIDERRFVLEGRGDQVVKVGEKRLDLTQMTSALRAHVNVEDAVLAAIDRDGELRVAAVVVPSEVGSNLIEREGRGSYSRALRASLALHFDPVLHPRYWRIVSELPTNSQGKLPVGAVRALFGASPQSGSLADRPEVLDEFRGEDVIERSCRVPLDLACFSGHFPDRPVVPGVLQLDWGMELVAILQQRAPELAEVESLKLISPLRPGQRFRLQSRLLHGEKFEIKLWSQSATYAIGCVRLEGAPAGIT